MELKRDLIILEDMLNVLEEQIEYVINSKVSLSKYPSSEVSENMDLIKNINNKFENINDLIANLYDD